MDSKISLSLIKNWQALCNDIVFTEIAPSLLQNKVITVNEYQHIVSQAEPAKVESLLLLLLKKNDTVLIKFWESLEKDYIWLADRIKEDCREKGKEEGRDETDAVPIKPIVLCKSSENDTTTEDEKDMCMECNSLNPVNKSNLNNRIKIKNGKLQRRSIIKSRMKNRLKPKVQNFEAIVSSTTELEKPVLNEEITNEVITVIKNCSLLSKSWTTIAHSLGLTDQVHDIRFKVIIYDEDLSMCIVYLIKNWLEMFPKTATLSKLIEVLRNENFNRVADELTEILYRKPVITDSKVHETQGLQC